MSKCEKPLVSIMIPNYNHSRYLGTCIESALNQTYENLEIVVLDNMSQDNSVSIAEQYITRGVRVCRNVFNVFNRSYIFLAERLTSGKYMMLLCADDYIHPAFVSRAVEIMEEFPNIGYVHGERDFITEDGQMIELDPFFQCSFQVAGQSMMPLYMVTTIAHPSQGIFRRKTYLEAGGYDMEIDHMNADRALWYHLSFVSDYAYIRDKMCCIRVGNQTETFLTQSNFQHPILCHLTIKSFVRFAERHGLQEVLAREEEAVRRLAQEFVGYAAGMLLEDNRNTAQAYLDYAVILDRTVIQEQRYQTVENVLNGSDRNQEKLKEICRISLVKKRGYHPPQGFEKLRVG